MKISEKRCVVLDMDGTVYVGSIPITGAVDFLKKYWDKLDFYFLSNNTSKSPDTYVKRLNSMGIPATLDLILSPTTPLVDFLKENGIRTHVLKKILDGSDEIAESIRQGHIAYVINTSDPSSSGVIRDGVEIRKYATENNVTMFTSLDTVRVLLDVLEETTLTISTIDA